MNKKPCMRCGECCKLCMCSIGINSFGTDVAPCPGLRKMDGVYSCHVLVNSEYYDYEEEQIKDILGIEFGCRNSREHEEMLRKMWAPHRRRIKFSMFGIERR